MNFIPYWDDVKGAPQNSIIGGASLWVMGGKTNNAYKGVAQVLRLPLAARGADGLAHEHGLRADHARRLRARRKKSGYYDKNPGADVAIKQLTNKPPTANSKGLRFGNYVQGREVIEEEMEGVFAGKKDAKTRARRGGAARQRDPAQVRGREPRLTGETRGFERSGRRRDHGKARRLPVEVAAVRAARAADRGHGRLLLLARGAGGLLLVPGPGPVRQLERSSSGSRTSATSSTSSQLPRVVQGHRALQRRWSRRAASRSRSSSPRWPTASCAARSSTRRSSSGRTPSRPRWRACCGPSCSRPRSASSPISCASMGIDWNWIINGDQAMLLVVIAATWKQISYNFLFFLAGLQSIPRVAASRRRRSTAPRPSRRFWTIVFPLLSPTTFFLLVINIVYAFFDTFGVIDATTQGGPAGATQILVYKVYYDGVKAADLGGSAAQSVILMFIVISLTVVQFRFVEKKVQY